MTGKRNTLLVVLVIAVVAVGAYQIWRSSQAKPMRPAGQVLEGLITAERALGPGDPSSQRVRVMIDEWGDPRWGSPDAPITIIHFGDLDIPESRRVEELLHAVSARAERKVRIVQKPFPQQAASPLAEALFAAQAQNRYQPFAEQLLRHKGAFDRATLDRCAREAGLHLKAFQIALDAGTFQPQVTASKTYGRRLGIQLVPTLFVNGKRIEGEVTSEQLQALIDEDLALMASRGWTQGGYTAWMTEARPGSPIAKIQGRPALDYSKTYVVPINDDDPSMGNPGAEHTLVLFSDLQCPHCARAETMLLQLMKDYDHRLRIVWKHFPLSIHREARLAHEASHAAFDQGRFWDFAHLAMSHQDRLDRASLEEYAGQIGLDVKRFREALDTGRFREKVEEGVRLARQLGVAATPTVFVDGRPLKGVDRQAIENALQGKISDGGEDVAPPEIDPSLIAAGGEDNMSVPAVGPANAPVEVVFLVDYETPGCSRLWRVVKSALAEKPQAFRVMVKHRPAEIHPRAEQLARLALAADRQGKFWEVHEALLARSDYGVPVDTTALGDRLGLDKEAWFQDADSPEIRASVARQNKWAIDLKVLTPPAIIVNGQFIRTSKMEERVRAVLEEASSRQASK